MNGRNQKLPIGDWLTLDQAAEALGVSRRTVNAWLAGKTWEAHVLEPVTRLSYKRVLLSKENVAVLKKLRRVFRRPGGKGVRHAA